VEMKSSKIFDLVQAEEEEKKSGGASRGEGGDNIMDESILMPAPLKRTQSEEAAVSRAEEIRRRYKESVTGLEAQMKKTIDMLSTAFETHMKKVVTSPLLLPIHSKIVYTLKSKEKEQTFSFNHGTPYSRLLRLCGMNVLLVCANHIFIHDCAGLHAISTLTFVVLGYVFFPLCSCVCVCVCTEWQLTDVVGSVFDLITAHFAQADKKDGIRNMDSRKVTVSRCPAVVDQSSSSSSSRSRSSSSSSSSVGAGAGMEVGRPGGMNIGDKIGNSEGVDEKAFIADLNLPLQGSEFHVFAKVRRSTCSDIHGERYIHQPVHVHLPISLLYFLGETA
jgi:hypothetical protein